jgi:hypothetical protein
MNKNISKSEFVIVICILIMIAIVSWWFSYELKRKKVVDDLNYLTFLYHLGLSKGVDGVHIINYNEALNIQNNVIKTLNCSRNQDYCVTFDGDLVSGSFLEISYVNTAVEYIKIYSKRIDFAFNNNLSTEPYSKGLFLPNSFTQSTSFRVGRPNTSAIVDMMSHVSHGYYIENDLKTPVTESDCTLAGIQCFDVLTYTKKIDQ